MMMIGADQTFRVHSTGGINFLHKMTSWPPSQKCDIKLKIWLLCQSMCIYLKNMPTKFHPDPIWNDGALDFFEEVAWTRRRRV